MFYKYTYFAGVEFDDLENRMLKCPKNVQMAQLVKNLAELIYYLSKVKSGHT